ncbi:DUF5615 family PIN-like protein [Ferrovum sp.]|uniref:DUF5615 family PIN-like protein n=1 Tax=Ferrovum sp. TaxID=2609467 RepID=UPI002605A946|nr:DUF5615 family PIN-like protein [Ferrovum sp.]
MPDEVAGRRKHTEGCVFTAAWRGCGGHRQSNPGICDEQVIGFARDQQRILLSFDRDHGDLIFGRAFAPPRAVVYLRLYPPNTETLEQILAGLMALGEKILDGQFTVISEDNMRQRALPGAS